MDSAGARPVDATGGVIVAGMGGSAAGGAARASRALGPRLRRPLVVSDGYTLPGWAGPSTLVLCSSYSGNTEETLAAYDDAVARARRGSSRRPAARWPSARARRRAGDPDPGRLPAARGDRLLARRPRSRRPLLAGAAPSVRDEIEAAAALAEELAAEWGPDGAEDSEAKSIARALHGTVPVIAGAELAAAAAYRWKCQFNENAELPAFASVLPGGRPQRGRRLGRGAARSGTFSYVSLEDPGAHPRNARRAELTAEIAAAGAVARRARAPRAARRRSSGSSRSSCSAISSRSTSPSCAASTRSTSPPSTASRPRWRAAR